ncbi:xanthine dehydrogenase family protein molybdopterin-binding subunit [Aquisphaera insulae]|uniref:xanthine dehydrogenase family protein molybdopterin-binding subunit n=1 Tax=Aquisphaera insulae TaxID=2712864 RepID=UPI0013EA7659|nr:xanthine dehydrogenase family protein molybdopterin-binding subunit [Aquisphaera insulae]
MSEIVNVSRRDFLRTGLLAGGGLVLGLHLPSLAPARPPEAREEPFALNAFVRIGPDDSVTVLVNHSEMGQGPYTSVPMLVAEELDADWSKVRFAAAPVAAVYNHTVYGVQMTGGSTSTWTEWERVRKAGAAARAMLIAAAAAEWGVEPATCGTEPGRVVHAASGRRIPYGRLAEKAADLKPPEHFALKDPKDFRIVGRSTHRLDTPDKVNGGAVFGLDVQLPGMLVALVARPPVLGGKVKSFNADRARAVPGVRHVLQIPRGIAVVADGFWPAKKGREALEVDWDDGPLSGLDSRAQLEHYAELAKQPGVAARKVGDAAEALRKADRTFEAEYDLPYLAHAPMEPLNCVADVRADRCEVWVGTQFQTGDRDAAAQESGLKPEQVTLHTTLLGGGFGRRAVLDGHFVREAVQISRAVGAPVKVIWTREDDTRGGYYRPRAYHAVRAALDASGAPAAWEHHVVVQSFLVGTPFAMLIKDGVDMTAVEGAADLPYAIPNIRVDWHQAPEGVPTQWWRSVGHSHTAFVVETLIDELAHAAGKDPLEFRRGLLGEHPRVRRVLEFVAEKAGWGRPTPPGRGRGIAVHESFGSYAAHVAEVSVSEAGKVRVHRVVAAIDCGPVVNPDTILAQLEGGTAFGLTAALHGEISFENGRVKQRNFHDYPLLRMHEMPVVEPYIVPSTDRMGGVGEPGVPSVAPALANAIFAACGKRLRRLPIRAADLKSA